MTTSILNDVKHTLGFLPEDTSYDGVIVMHINSVFGTLNQLGVGPVEGFQIEGKDETWDQFFDDPRLNSVKSYVFLRVKLLFDAPQSGFEIAAMERQIDELTYRINVAVEYG